MQEFPLIMGVVLCSKSCMNVAKPYIQEVIMQKRKQVLIDSELHQELKIQAAKEGRPVVDLVNDAVCIYLFERPDAHQPAD